MSSRPQKNPDGKYAGTTWQVTFDMPSVPQGTATLRLAICGARGNSLDAFVNGHPLGTFDLPNSGVMHRDGIRATEVERDFPFDTSLLVKGENHIELKTNARDWTDGVLYDYLRLEVAGRKVSAVQEPSSQEDRQVHPSKTATNLSLSESAAERKELPTNASP